MSKESENMEKPSRNRRALHIMFTALFVLGLLILFPRVSKTKTFIDATTHQPQQYTELYFTDSQNLPGNVPATGTTIPVSFTIHNVEDKNMQYTYDIVLTDSSGQKLLAQKSLQLTNGQSEHRADTVKLPKFSGKADISVLLLHQPESIHFWVTAES